MASGPITSWQIDGETMETVRYFILGVLQNHCVSWLHPWNEKTVAPLKKSYDQCRQHIKKQRHYFANKGPSSQSYGFPIVMYGCESWTIKKAERWWIDAFELCCWRRLLRVPWTARRSNQSILKEINSKYPLEGLMLRPKLQYFGHLMWRIDSLAKTLMLGKLEGRRRRGQQDEMAGWHHWFEGHEFKQAPGAGDGQGSLACCSPWGRRVVHDWATELNCWDFPSGPVVNLPANAGDMGSISGSGRYHMWWSN